MEFRKTLLCCTNRETEAHKRRTGINCNAIYTNKSFTEICKHKGLEARLIANECASDFQKAVNSHLFHFTFTAPNGIQCLSFTQQIRVIHKCMHVRVVFLRIESVRDRERKG